MFLTVVLLLMIVQFIGTSNNNLLPYYESLKDYSSGTSSTTYRQEEDEEVAVVVRKVLYSTSSNDSSSSSSSSSSNNHYYNSTISNDIESIIHIPTKQKIVIEFKKRQRSNCPHPYLIGRLSGPALIKLDFTTSSSSIQTQEDDDDEITTKNNVTIMTGTYTLPPPRGVGSSSYYFLEIILVMCNAVVPPSIVDFEKRNNLKSLQEYNFRRKCVEDCNRHLVLDTTIEVVVVASQQQQQSSLPELQHPLGYWMSTVDMDTTNSRRPYPLYTRYQPQNCRSSDAQQDPRCTQPTSLERFESYQFQWTNEDIYQQLKRSQTKISICAFGWSHTRVLLGGFNTFKDAMNMSVTWGKARYPNDVTTDLVGNLVNQSQCTKLIFGVGQWPASSSKNPTSLQQYYKEIKSMLGRIQQAFPHLELFARSIHYNPLGDSISSCPPKDHRNPVVIDGYNYIIQQVVHDMNANSTTTTTDSSSSAALHSSSKNKNNRIMYIDTNFIVGPVWDTSPDWCHLNSDTSQVEALYIASVMMSDSSGGGDGGRQGD